MHTSRQRSPQVIMKSYCRRSTTSQSSRAGAPSPAVPFVRFRLVPTESLLSVAPCGPASCEPFRRGSGKEGEEEDEEEKTPLDNLRHIPYAQVGGPVASLFLTVQTAVGQGARVVVEKVLLSGPSCSPVSCGRARRTSALRWNQSYQTIPQRPCVPGVKVR